MTAGALEKVTLMPVTRRGISAMTVDVEDYFQVSAFERHVDRRSWDSIDCRVAGNVDSILSLFDETSTKATFFVLGWIAERFPQVVARIASQGHEIASHGYDHTRVYMQTPEQFRQDVAKTKRIIEDVVGSNVMGYRAATYSINASNIWALEVLAEVGHVYSSSIYPIRHDLYGMPNAPRAPFRWNASSVVELPITTVSLLGYNVPCGGGGYFRLFPYALSRWALRRYMSEQGLPGIFYFHPWEIDVRQPRVAGVGFRTRFRHYLNLSRMAGRLKRLLGDFKWDRVDKVFDGAIR